MELVFRTSAFLLLLQGKEMKLLRKGRGRIVPTCNYLMKLIQIVWELILESSLACFDEDVGAAHRYCHFFFSLLFTI